MSQYGDGVAHRHTTASTAHTMHAELLHGSRGAHASGEKAKLAPRVHHLSEEWSVASSSCRQL